jgi:hypothetical protein
MNELNKITNLEDILDIYINIVKLLQNPYLTKQQKKEIDKDLKTLDEIRFHILKNSLHKN